MKHIIAAALAMLGSIALIAGMMRAKSFWELILGMILAVIAYQAAFITLEKKDL